jgi:hypothetical protein
MLLSVFTPTNNVQYLDECYRSLEVQTYADWEWILAPNGDAIGNLPAHFASNPRIKIHEYDGPANIGAMKKFCCDRAAGDVYVELDHDDVLVPGIFENVVAQVQTGAGFVYSDAAVFLHESGQPVGYNENWGWETYPFRVYGQEFLASRAFDITARSLCEVYYAPDHIRCWTAEAYKKTGGHNTELEVGDDHDLICRTYVAGYKFAHTNTCGYLYRNHPGNTVKSHNAKIQQQQYSNRDKYLYPLIDEWTNRQKLGYIDLTWHYEHLAFDDDGVPTLLWDDSSVGSIRAYDFLQRLPATQMTNFIRECYRVLAPGGWLCIAVPSTDGQGAFMPHCRSYWNQSTFLCWTRRDHADLIENEDARFQQVRCFTQFGSNRELANVPYVYADLCALKGQRQPGRVWI